MHHHLAGTESAGRQRYENFVAQGQGVRLWKDALVGQIYLGGERFIEKIQIKNKSIGESQEIPRTQRRGAIRSLDQYLQHRRGRNEGVLRAYREGGYTQTAIAKKLGLSVSRISRLIQSGEAKGKT